MSEPFLADATIQFGSGRLTLQEVDAFFRTMPYELDYIDASDHYVWYSPNPWRDEDRLQGRLNHHFFGCHPKRVLPMVKQVLELLKSGQKEVVESPQVIGGHRTLIRYYAIRTVAGHYLGTLEVTEDVEHIAHLVEQHTFEHGIVEGQVVDGTSSASINARQ